jgi:hypothetical protein
MKSYRKRILLLLLLMVSIVIPQRGFADDSKVKTGPELVESNPSRGASSVSIDTEIYLLFNKNVVNMRVKENNVNNIRLIDGSGKEIPIDIIFADDQIEPEKRREILVKPKENLKKSTTYKVQILPDFMAKNGKKAGELIEVAFETEKEQEDAQPPKKEETKEVVKTEVKPPVEEKGEERHKGEKAEDKVIAQDEEADREEVEDVVESNEVEGTREEKKEVVDEKQEVADDQDTSDEIEVNPKNNLARNLSIIAIVVVALISIKKVRS